MARIRMSLDRASISVEAHPHHPELEFVTSLTTVEMQIFAGLGPARNGGISLDDLIPSTADSRVFDLGNRMPAEISIDEFLQEVDAPLDNVDSGLIMAISDVHQRWSREMNGTSLCLRRSSSRWFLVRGSWSFWIHDLGRILGPSVRPGLVIAPALGWCLAIDEGTDGRAITGRYPVIDDSGGKQA
jgi:hypothetical protein